MRNGRNRISNSFYGKICALLFTIMASSLLLISVIIFTAYFQYYVTTVADYNLQTIGYIEEKVDSLLADTTLITDQLYLEKNISRLLESPDDSGNNQSKFQTYMGSYKFADPLFNYQIDLFDFYGNRYNFYNSAALTHGFLYFSDVTQYSWYQTVMDAGGRTIWIDGASINPDASDMLFAARLIKNVSVNRPNGIVVVSFMKRRLTDGLKKDTQNNAGIYLTDLNGEVIVADKNTCKQEDGFRLDFTKVSDEQGYYTEGARLVVYTADQVTGWYVVQTTMLPTMPQFFIKLFWPLVSIAFFSLLVAAGISYAIYRKISAPIQGLMHCMKMVEAGDLDRPDLDTERDDEIGQLNRGYVSMIEELRNLLKALMQEQEAKRVAGLKALQAQINPHFLYNTLGSARYLIRMGQNEDAGKVLISLVKLLKVNLNTRVDTITVSQELECLKNYELIQKFKFENFTIHYLTDPEVLHCLIPKLLIQPLVENSIFHGMKSGEISGEITIIIGRCEDRLTVSVQDTGCGFSSGSIDALYETRTEHNGTGIGLKNVNERLVLRYGEASKLKIENGPDGTGGIVRFSIPLEQGGD